LVEQGPFKALVLGSSPSRPTISAYLTFSNMIIWPQKPLIFLGLDLQDLSDILLTSRGDAGY
jgi:hypothetical protein